LIDRKNLELAASLIAKAQRTDFDGEAIALVEKSYHSWRRSSRRTTTRSNPHLQALAGANAGCFEIHAPRDGVRFLETQIVRRTQPTRIANLTENRSIRTKLASTLRRRARSRTFVAVGAHTLVPCGLTVTAGVDTRRGSQA
jgi:hypothetical protein